MADAREREGLSTTRPELSSAYGRGRPGHHVGGGECGVGTALCGQLAGILVEIKLEDRSLMYTHQSGG